LDLDLEAQSLIKRHVLMSMAAGAIPLPLVDIAAVTALRLELVKALSAHYGVACDRASSKAIIGALTGSTLTQLGASVVKAVPFVGSLIGGVTQVVLSGAATYALGAVFARHFQRGGSVEGLDLKAAGAEFSRLFEEGKAVVARWQREPAGDTETQADTLAQLRALHAGGELSDAQLAEIEARFGSARGFTGRGSGSSRAS